MTSTLAGDVNGGNGLSTPYKGVTGTYTAPDATTGRFTDQTSLSGVTANHVDYLISDSEFVEMERIHSPARLRF